MFTLSDDITLNQGPAYNYHPPNLKQRDVFVSERLYLCHLIVNNLLPKIDEFGYTGKLTYVALVGITESKLENYILDSEIQIDNYLVFHYGRKRNRQIVTCDTGNEQSYTKKEFFPE